MTKSRFRKNQQTEAPETIESPVFELLEPRVLYSADAIGVGSVLLPDDSSSSPLDYVGFESVSDADSNNDPQLSAASGNANPALEIVFIDSRVPDADKFIDAWASPDVQFVVIHENDDALAVISQHMNTLAESVDSVSTLRIVSHGGDGFLQLGNAAIDENALNENAHLLATWSDAMTGDADILLYGCNVAQSSTGLSFVETLAQITDADVAASNDVTGGAAQGGDWDLEVSYGVTSDFKAVDTQKMAEWTNTLAVIEVSYRADDAGPNSSSITVAQFNGLTNGTLRQAIDAANNTAGDDVIHLIGDLGDFELREQLIANSTINSGNLVIENHTGTDAVIRPEVGLDIGLFYIGNNSLTLAGDSNSNGDQIILRDGSNIASAGGAIDVDNGASLVVNHVSFLNNQANSPLFKEQLGGAIHARGAVTINNSVFEGNSGLQGGAIHIRPLAPEFSINNSVFNSNTATTVNLAVESENHPLGGAIYSDTSGTIENSTFTSNTSETLGGAVYISAKATEITINETSFHSNKAQGPFSEAEQSGGAIYSNETSTIQNSTFIANTAEDSGGAINANENINVVGSVFTGNSATTGGALLVESDATLHDSGFHNHSTGGAVVSTGSVTVTDSIFSKNHWLKSDNAGGGAIRANGNVIVNGSEFLDNTAAIAGGAILASNVEISNSHFQGNEAIGHLNPDSSDSPSSGGAVAVIANGSITNSSFVGNKAEVGSAVLIAGASQNDPNGNPFFTLTIHNSTFSGNQTVANNHQNQSSVGTVAAAGYSELIVTSSTFVDNDSVSISAGIAASVNASATVGLSVFLNNTVGNSDHGDLSNVVSIGYNVSDEDLTKTNASDSVPTDIIDANLMLGALTSQAGSVVNARPLLAGSSAINTGPSAFGNDTDTFGEPRDSMPDAGAVEFQGNSDSVFWADTDGKIWRSNADFTSPVLILDTGHDVSGLVVDPNGFNNDGTGRILWVNQDTSEVYSALLDGTGMGAGSNALISSGPVAELGGATLPFTVNSLAFDQHRDVLFAAHAQTQYHSAAIRVWEIDTVGSSYLGQIENPGGYTMENPRDIHYNAATGRLYWIDGVPGSTNATLHSSYTDGSGYELLHTATSADDLRGLVTDDSAQALFFTNQTTNTVNRFDLITNTVTSSVEISSPSSNNGVNDITFLSSESEVVVTDLTANKIHVFNEQLISSGSPYDHSGTPEIVASATTTANQPSFYTETFHYTESAAPEPITANHIVVSNPTTTGTQNITFALVSEPETNGGTLVLDGNNTLQVGDEFSLAQSLTYANNSVTDETRDIFQIQMYVDGIAVGPEKAFIVTLHGVDDAATFSIAPIFAIENTDNTPLNVADFTLVDEENVTPEAYSVIPNGLTDQGVKILVDGIATNYFTHEDLELGKVTISTIDTVITPANASTPVTAILEIRPQVGGVDIFLNNPTGPSSAAILTVEIDPADDKAQLTINQSVVQLNENSTRPLFGAAFQFQDEESIVDDVIYRVTDTGDPSLAIVTLNNPNSPSSIPLNVGDTFTHAQFIANWLQVDTTHANLATPTASTEFSFQAVTDLSDPTFSSASDPLTLTIDVLQANDRPTVDVVIPTTGLVANENSITTLSSSLFDYNDEENDALLYYELVLITKADGTGPINNVNFMNNEIVMAMDTPFTVADLNAGRITIDATNAQLLSDEVLHIHLRAVSEENDSHGITDTTQPQDLTTHSESFILVVDVQSQDDAPVLFLNQTDFDISEGLQPTVISSNVFRFTDEENNALSHYVLMPVSLPAGIEINNASGPVNSQITLDELANGDITISAENAVIVDDIPQSYTLTFYAVDENGKNSNTVDLSINVTPVNDNPTISPIMQFMSENSTLTLTSEMFNLLDEETPDGAVYTLSAAGFVSNSEFSIGGINQGPGSGVTFTQSDLDNGLVEFSTVNANFPNGANTLIQFGLDVTLEDGTSTIHTQFEISLAPVNEIPTLEFIPDVLSVNEDSLTVLSDALFVVTDEENETPVSYSINNFNNNQQFTIEIAGNPTPLQQGDTFTHDDLIAGNVLINTTDINLSVDSTSTLTIAAIMPSEPNSQPTQFTVNVIAVDDQPTIAPVTQTIDEGDQLLLTPAMFQYFDEESQQTGIYTLNSAANIGGAEFFLNNVSQGTSVTFNNQQLVNGQVYLSTASANYAGGPPAILNFELNVETPTGQTTATSNFLVMVNPINDAPVLSLVDNTVTVNENSAVALSIANFSLVDEEGDNPIEYIISTDISVAPFTLHINGSTVPLSANDSFTHQDLVDGNVLIDATDADLSSAFSQSLVLHALMDDGPSSNIVTLDITINPVNDIPTLSPAALSINEGDETTLDLATFNFYDEETPNSATYTVATNDDLFGSAFIIDGVKYPSNASFTHAQLLNGDVVFSTQDANIPEGQSTQVSFATQIQPISGPESASMLLTIDITPVNEAAELSINSSAYTFDENTQVVLSENDFIVTDEEGNVPVEYIIGTPLSTSAFNLWVQGGAAPLSIGDTFSHQDLIAGNVIIDATDADLSSQFNQSVLLTAVMDDGPASTPTPLFIAINPVNDTPTIAPVNLSLNEGGIVTFDASTFNYFDEETPNSAVYTLATNDNLHNSSLMVDGVDAGTNASFTHAQLIAGLVAFDTQNAAIPEGQPTAITFVVNVQPSTGPASTAKLMDIIVHPVNEASALSFTSSVFEVQENSFTALLSSNFVITDEEGNLPIEYIIGSDLSAKPYTIYTAGSNIPLAQGESFSHQDLIDGNVIVDASNADLNAVFSDNIDLAAVMNDGSSTPYAPFALAVLPVNDTPTLSPVNATLDEGDVVVLSPQTFNYQDEETPQDAVYVVATNDDLFGSVFYVDGQASSTSTTFTHQQLQAGLVSFDTQDANIPEGQSIALGFVVQVSPATGPASTPTQWDLAINPVNELPELLIIDNNFTVTENSSTALSESNFIVQDEENDLPAAYEINTDLANSPFTLSVVGSSMPLSQGDSFTHDDLVNGRVIVDATQADLSTPFSQGIQFIAVTDNAQSTAPATFNLTIAPDNDIPTLTPQPIQLDEGDVVILDAATLNYADEESPNTAVYNFSTSDNLYGAELLINGVSAGQNGSFTHTELINGLISFSTTNANIPQAQNTSVNFVIVAQPDTGPASKAALLNIDINPVNEAPTLSFINNTVAVDENTFQVLTPANLIITDEELDTPAAYQIGSNLDNSPFTVHLLGNSTPLSLGDIFSHQDLVDGRVLINAENADINTAFNQSVFLTAIMTDGPNSNPAPLLVSLNPVDDAATLAPVTLTVDEGTLTQLNHNTFGYEDEEDSSTRYTLNSISTNNGTVIIVDGQTLAAGDTFEHQDLLDGTVFLSTENTLISDNVAQPTLFSVTAIPDIGPASTAEVFTVIVSPTDDIPTLAPLPQQLVENNALVLDISMFGYSDEESDPLSHIVIESVNNDLGVLLTVNGIPVTDGDVITVAQLNQSLVSLDATAADTGFGDSIALAFHAVTDGDQRSETRILSTTVLPENDAAILNAQSSAISVDEGASVALSDASFTFLDEENATISEYVIESLPTESGVTIDKNGIALEVGDTFTQEDLNDGLVVVNAVNAPVLQSSMGALKVYALVDDGTRTNATDLQFNFLSVEDVPQLTTTTVGSATEGSTTVIQPEQFIFEDADGDTLTEYRLVSSLSTDGFSVQREGVNLLPDDTFTQLDLIAGIITIHSDGSDLNSTQIDQFTVLAVSSNGVESNNTDVIIILQPSDDAPTLSAGLPIVANENELTPLTPENFTVTDSENDAPTAYTLITPLTNNIGAISVSGEPLLANESFTHTDLIAGNVQIDLQALDINTDTTADFELSVTAGAQSSAPQTMQVIISESNDAPEFSSNTPLTYPSLAPGDTISIPANSFSDSDGDEITYSAVVVLNEAGNTEPLPEWLLFDPETLELQLAGEPNVSELDILIIAEDQNNGQASTVTALTFEDPPELAAAEPEPVVLAVVESPDTGPDESEAVVVAPEPVVQVQEEAPEPEKNDAIAEAITEEEEAEVSDSPAFDDDSQIITSGIQSSRVDLASLLPSLNLDADNANELNNDKQTTEAILSELIGLSGNADGSDPFNISNFESQTYQRGLDSLANRWDDDEELAEPVLINIDTTVGSSVGLSSGFTVGYMIWLLRGGTLMGSVLSSLPAWRLVDPLPVLAELDGDLDEDNESLESMVSQTNETEETEETQEDSENQNAHH